MVVKSCSEYCVAIEVTALIEMLVTVMVAVSWFSTVEVTVYGMLTVLAGKVSVTVSVAQRVLAGGVEVDHPVPSALDRASKDRPIRKILVEHFIVKILSPLFEKLKAETATVIGVTSGVAITVDQGQ